VRVEEDVAGAALVHTQAVRIEPAVADIGNLDVRQAHGDRRGRAAAFTAPAGPAIVGEIAVRDVDTVIGQARNRDVVQGQPDGAGLVVTHVDEDALAGLAPVFEAEIAGAAEIQIAHRQVGAFAQGEQGGIGVGLDGLALAVNGERRFAGIAEGRIDLDVVLRHHQDPAGLVLFRDCFQGGAQRALSAVVSVGDQDRAGGAGRRGKTDRRGRGQDKK